MGFDLNKASKDVKKLAKGSQEWAMKQNEINRAMGVKKRHTVIGTPRDKDVKLANAKANVQKKAGKTLKAVKDVATYAKKKSPEIKKALAGVKAPKAKKKTRIAGGM